MERVVEETEYVLTILRQMLKEVTATPELFALDAQQEIKKAIAYMECVRQKAETGQAA